jgi:hypothetical protein
MLKHERGLQCLSATRKLLHLLIFLLLKTIAKGMQNTRYDRYFAEIGYYISIICNVWICKSPRPINPILLALKTL